MVCVTTHQLRPNGRSDHCESGRSDHCQGGIKCESGGVTVGSVIVGMEE